MSSRLEFLDWNRPPLLLAMEYLRRRYLHAGAWDLHDVIVVVPGRRAGRRLLELLAFAAAEEHLDFSPPRITTEGQLPELLYHPRQPFACTLTQELAWSHALRSMQAEVLRAITPHPPATNDEAGWLALGALLRGVHCELTADAMTFDDALRKCAELSAFPDRARWEAMSLVQLEYLRTLDALQLWDIQTARLVAIRQKEIATTSDIVLLGSVDLSRTMRQILDQIPERVTALIPAPETMCAAFDRHGCLHPAVWQQIPIPLRTEQVWRVDRPADQADAVARILASYEGRYRSDQITIGLADERLVPQLERELRQCSVPVRWVQGKMLPETAPLRLMKAAAEFLISGATRDFAALVRHPDVYHWLTRETGPSDESMLNQLDQLQNEYLVAQIDPESWPHKVNEPDRNGKPQFGSLREAIARTQEWLHPLQGARKPLAQWSPLLLAWLQVVLGTVPLSRDSRAALEKIRDVCQEQGMLPRALDVPLTAAEAIRWTANRLAGEAVAPPADDDAVELLGWLELPLDDAPALIVTTFNEGFVPESVVAHAFLPNSLRQHLGLLDNDRRYARDAFNLALLLHSRENVQLVTGRRDRDDNPLMPSRLLFAASEDEIVARAQTFFKPLPAAPVRPPLVGRGIPLPLRTGFVVPLPVDPDEPWESLRVTQFRDYLTCPYRFYLKHVLKLAAVGELPEELAGNQFGNLAHDVLQAFGRDAAVRHSEQPEQIAAWLEDQLERRVRLRYGDRQRLAAVEMQLEQLRARLRKFAQWQARRAQEGWQIVYTEDTDETSPAEPTALLSLGEISIQLRGRIDRIDRHVSRDEVAIFDYKTADGGDRPDRTHRRKKEWIDLQLPLYRHLARAWGHTAGTIHLGYILLPRALDDVGDAVANWSEDDLRDADATALRVIEALRKQIYWPPSEAPEWTDDFTAICQDRRLGGRNLEE